MTIDETMDSSERMNPVAMTIINPRKEYWLSPTALTRYTNLTLYHTIPTIMTLKKKAFENIVEKGENAGNQHFLLLPQCFLLIPRQTLIF